MSTHFMGNQLWKRRVPCLRLYYLLKGTLLKTICVRWLVLIKYLDWIAIVAVKENLFISVYLPTVKSHEMDLDIIYEILA